MSPLRLRAVFRKAGLKLCAFACLALGRMSAAQRQFDALLLHWPDDAYALASSAHLLAQAGDYEAALTQTRRLVQAASGDGRAWFNHAYLLEATGRWQEALAAFRRSVELRPELDRAWYGQALVLIRLRRPEQAIAPLQRQTELQPMSPHGWYQLARIHADAGDAGQALEIIRHLRTFEPGVAAQLQRETGLLLQPNGA